MLNHNVKFKKCVSCNVEKSQENGIIVGMMYCLSGNFFGFICEEVRKIQMAFLNEIDI